MSQQLELLTTDSSSQWSTIANVIPEIQKKEIRPFVILSLKELEGNPDIRTSSLASADKFACVRAVVRHAARLRSATGPWSAADMRTFLEGLKFSPECTAELTVLLCAEEAYRIIPSHLRTQPGLASMQWKIDISLCQVNRDAENADESRTKEIMHRDAHVVLTLRLTDDTQKTYRLTVTKFHKMRFTIATLLKNMLVLEKRKCMRKD